MTEAPRAGTFELLRAVLSLGADLDLSSVLQRFVQVSAQLTNARYAAINVLDASGASTTFVQYGVPETAAARLANSPHAIGVLGAIPDYGVLRLRDLREHPAFQGYPAGHPDMGPFLGTAVRVHEEIFGYLYLADKHPEFEDADVDVVLALAAAAAVAIQNAQLYADARARENWLRAGQEITTLLLSGAEEDEALERIAVHAREIAEADSAVLILPGMGGELVMEIVDGDGKDALLGTVMPRDGRAWRTMRGGAGELVESLYAHRQVRLQPMRQFGPALYAPMTAEGHAMGVLVLLRNIGRAPFGPHDLLTARSFAAQAALALRLADARHVRDAEALLDERERIARDLHDLAVQQLFATGMQLESLRRKAARGGVSPVELEVPVPMLTYTWLVGPVPVTLDLSADIIGNVSATAQASATAKASFSYSGDAGFSFEGAGVSASGATDIGEMDPDPADSAAPMGIDVDAQFGVAFPSVSLSILGQGVVPHLHAGVVIGSRLEWGDPAAGFAASSICKSGYARMEVVGGVDLVVLGHTLAEKEHVIFEDERRGQGDGCPEDAG